MAIEVFNRYEKKFIIDDDTCNMLKEEFSKYMEADSHSRDGAIYTISNIYYDTPDNELIRRSIEKPVYKEKLRLRSYGTVPLDAKVFLEIKKKYNGLVNKRRTKILLSDAYRFIESKHFTNGDGSLDIPDFMNRQILKELTFFLERYENLEPALYLAYDRCAMFGINDKDLRVTFDKNIITRRYDLGLHYGNYGDKLLEDGKWIMEIKVNHTMPMWMVELLSKHEIRSTSFSKYGTEYKGMITEKADNGKAEAASGLSCA